MKGTHMKYFLYTDGVYYPRLDTVGIGGHLENEQGDHIWEFSEKIENSHITNQFKIQSIVHGLKKCISNGVKNVECFTDDQTLVETLNTTNKVKKHNFMGRNPVFKEILSLLTKFDKIDFIYLPKNENKLSSSLARGLIEGQAKKLNAIKHTPVETNAFDLPNLITRAKYEDNREFMDAKVDVVKHFVFDLDTKDMTLKVYEIEKYPEMKVLTENRHKLSGKWTGSCIDIINNILSNSSEKEVGFIFNPTSNPVVKILKGLEPITFNTKTFLEKLTEVSTKFDKIVIHDDKNILEAALNPQIDKEEENELTLLKKREAKLIENLQILSDPSYKLGSNRPVEKFVELSRKQLEDLATVQKQYLGQLVRTSIQIEKLSPSENAINAKEKALNRVKEIKAKLESKGIKFKI
jgi:ribonuclease HI